MKNLRLFGIMLLLAVVAGSACKKEKVPAVENEDASDLIVHSFESDGFGLASQFQDALTLVSYYNDDAWCGYTGDTVFYRNYDGMAVNYSYTFNWDYSIICSGSTPVTATIGYSSSATTGSSVMTSDFTAMADWTITNLNSLSGYVLNGSYVRTGDFHSLLREQHTFDAVLNVTLTNVVLDTYTFAPASGSATLTLNCTAPNGETFVFDGTLEFQGSQNCTLTLEDKVYTFQL